MPKSTKNTENTDVAELKKLLAAQTAELQTKLEEMKQQNIKLTEELANLKANTEEENALLGQKIAKIAPSDEPKYNPFSPEVSYSVYNEEAKITTMMTGDEIEGIVGLREDIAAKLKLGAAEFDKFPYKVTKITEPTKPTTPTKTA